MRPDPSSRNRPPAQEAGFLLPLASAGALAMLLSSLSLQAAVLRERRLQLKHEQLQRQEDQLASAAHRLGAELTGRHRCLLTLPSDQWSGADPAEGCTAGSDPGLLLTTLQREQGVTVNRWQPTAAGGEMELQLSSGGTASHWSLTLAPSPNMHELD